MPDQPMPRELVETLAELARRRRTNKIAAYAPSPKQVEFHAAGADHRERLFSAGNQLGKTMAGSHEAAMHATGRYPDWWKGRRWSRPVSCWVGSEDTKALREGAQTSLLGRIDDGEQLGTGAIPADAIVGTTASRGAAGAIDTVILRHQLTGGTSRLVFKTYEQGRKAWQAATLDFVWFDEEPPADIYSEGLARIAATDGMVWLTCTPLLGMSKVQKGFYGDQLTPDKHRTMMTIDDAVHIPEKRKAQIIAGYPEHEREARTKGIPMRGSGLIFPVAESTYRVDQFPVPNWWPQLGALDFGWDHPTAAVKLAWDRDADCVYVTHCYRVRRATPVIHAAALKAWGPWLPWAWPHDGNNDTAAGENLSTQYRKQGLRMLPEHAQFEDGGHSVEAGLMDMLDRLQTGRLKVFAHLADWFEEARMYHRKDGKVVKEDDDLMSATRYGCMSLRFALVPGRPRGGQLHAVGTYDPYSPPLAGQIEMPDGRMLPDTAIH